MPMVRRAMFPQAVAGITLAAALLLAGCGSDDAADSGYGPPGSATPATASGTDQRTGVPGASTVTVNVDDRQFSPADITIKTGDTVTWTFRDSVAHNVQGIGDEAMVINSPIIREGEWSHTFTAPGSYRYLCTLHPEMRGTVTVEAR